MGGLFIKSAAAASKDPLKQCGHPRKQRSRPSWTGFVLLSRNVGSEDDADGDGSDVTGLSLQGDGLLKEGHVGIRNAQVGRNRLLQHGDPLQGEEAARAGSGVILNS